jgi:hypothetical protein
MGRVWLIAALVYGYGDPGFDGHRPNALNLPLQAFHRAVDATATNARHALVTLDDTRRNIDRFAYRLHHLSDVLP